MCRSRVAWTDEYAQTAGVGFVMRAKTAPAGSETRETERLAKEPGLCSTLRRRVRSGVTQAGTSVVDVEGGREEGEMIGLMEDFREESLVAEGAGGVEVMAAGDMIISTKQTRIGMEYGWFVYKTSDGSCFTLVVSSQQASNSYPSNASSLGLAGPTQSPLCIDMWGDTAYSMLPMVLVSLSRLSLTGFVGVGPRSL